MDHTALSSILFSHQSELKMALQRHPELYHELYSTEAPAIREQATRKGER
jgi:hypothetical protein